MASACFSLDDAWRFTDIDARAARYLEVVPAEVLGRVVWEVFPEAHRSEFEEACRGARESGKARWFDGPCIDCLGCDLKALLLPHAGGLDVFLRDSEERYRNLVSLLPVAIFTCGRDGRILLYNARAAELWGREPTLGDANERYCGAWRLRDADGRPMRGEDTPMATALRTEAAVRDREAVIERPDGSRLVISVNISLITGDDGALLGAVSVFEDITYRKESEKALLQSEAEAKYRAQEAEEGHATLEALLEFIPEGVCITGGPPDYRIKAASEFGLKMTGIAREDLLGLPARHHAAWRLLTPDGETVQSEDSPLSRVIKNGTRTLDQEFAMQTRDGRSVPVAIDAAPIHDSHGTIVGAVKCWRDISERKEIERQWLELSTLLERRVLERTAEVQHLVDELRRLAVELVRVEQRERKRLAKVLHDHIQQLLVAAKMRLEFYASTVDEPEPQANLLQIVDIIGESITTSRSLTVELSPPVLHESGLGHAIEWLARHLKRTHQFDVSVEVASDAEPNSEELRYLLFESVRELLFNAIKHSGTRAAHVAMGLAANRCTQIEVRDAGKGFDPENRARSGRGANTLGLFRIHQQLTHFGGGMKIESSPGHGVTATIWGPADAAYHPEDGARAEYVRAAPSEAAGSAEADEDVIRVLIVDDHQILREGLANLLGRQSDIEIIGESESAEEALAFVARQRPDAIIMDINLPGMNGIEATKIITRDYEGIVVIGLSMHEDRDIATAMHEAGARFYHTKGDPVSDLVQSLREGTQR